VALVIIDPMSSYMGKVDSHKNAEIRGVLEPIGEMASRLRVAILSITHFSKGGAGASTKALYRFIGSIAFTAAPRAAFVVMEDPEDKNRRLFLHGKNNLGPAPQGLAFRLEQRFVGEAEDILASSVVWDSAAVAQTADDALGAAGREADEGRTSTDEAADFLEQVLAAGPVPVRDVEQQAREAGLLGDSQPISQSKPIRDARSRLWIKSYQPKGVKAGGWLWAMPGHQMPSGPSDALHKQGAPDGLEGI
jgi:AAA domain